MQYSSNKMWKYFLILFVGLSAVTQVSAQSSTRAILVFFDNEQGIEISDSDGFTYDFLNFGMEIRPGDTIQTTESSAELQLQPDGSIIRIAQNSSFAVNSLYDSESAGEFSLQGGRMRAIVSRDAGSRFNVRTRTAVGGVRGTDFFMEVIPDERDAVFVSNGSVDFTQLETGQTIEVAQGQGANTFAEAFTADLWSNDAIAGITANMDFIAVNPDNVARQDATTEEPEEEPAETDDDVEIATDEDQADVGDVPTDITTPTVDQPGDPSEPAPTPSSDEDGIFDGFMGYLGGYLNMELGSITIGGETYGKVVLQPEFAVGKLGIGLYLPVIYQENLFAPETWYQPAGNNEWSFGTDAHFSGDDDEVWLRIQDFWQDLWLKIRYVRWGQQRDPFFLQAGNISTMTLGHGLLMHRFANDTDFPQVRRVGLNIGLDPGKAGAQFIVNDLANPEIYGARVFFRPAYPASRIAIGLSGAADIDPAAELIPDENITYSFETHEAKPIFLNFALDIDIPIIETSALSMVLFGDVGGFIPYLGSVPENSDLSSGVQYQAFYEGSGFDLANFNNYGMMSGILGSLIGLDYRLEYRNFYGIFEPLYDATYERFRPDYALNTVSHLLAPEQDDRTGNRVQGIYGEARAGILNDMILFELGYMWPWDSVGGVDTEDYLNAGISIEDDFLPLGIAGGVNYTRRGFAQAIQSDGQVSLFDPKTTFEGEVTYPIAPGMNIAVSVGTAAKRDSQGNLEYDNNGNLKSEFSFSIETRIGY